MSPENDVPYPQRAMRSALTSNDNPKLTSELNTSMTSHMTSSWRRHVLRRGADSSRGSVRCLTYNGVSVSSTLASTALLVLLAAVAMPTAGAIICEAISIPMCESMTYNLTRMPNLLHHSTQQNARLLIEQFEPLVNYSCSAHLTFFLCAMFVPICPKGFDQTVIPPCRGVCEDVRRHCEPVIMRYNLTWPDYLRCDDLPEYERGVCLTPDSIVTDSSETGFGEIPVVTPKPPKKKRKCNCKMNKGLKFRDIFKKRKYDFAIRGKFKQMQRVSGGPVVMTIYVRRVLMTTPRDDIPQKQEVTLWNQHGCKCKWMKPGGDYIVLGHTDSRKNRLLFDDRSFIEEGSKKLRDRIKQMAKDAKSKRQKKKKRGRRRDKKKKKGRKRPRQEGETAETGEEATEEGGDDKAKKEAKKKKKAGKDRRHGGKGGARRSRHRTGGQTAAMERELSERNLLHGSSPGDSALYSPDGATVDT